MSEDPSLALRNLLDALEQLPARADGNVNALDLLAAVRKALDSCEYAEWVAYMGEDL